MASYLSFFMKKRGGKGLTSFRCSPHDMTMYILQKHPYTFMWDMWPYTTFADVGPTC
jgi:hypothetical protein